MKRKLLNRTGMASTVVAYMDKNVSIWNDNNSIIKTVDDLKASLGGIGRKGAATGNAHCW
jgi:hypothetical protein